MSVRRTGFTLTDAVVAVATLAILLAMLLPAVRRSRMGDQLADELMQAQRLASGMTRYTQEYRDRIMPAAAHWTWCHAPYNKWSLIPYDPFVAQRRVDGSAIKVWTLHYLAWDTHTDPTKIQLDPATRTSLSNRATFGSVVGSFNGVATYQYADSTLQAAYAFHPSLGINGVFLGGSYPHGAFRGQGPGSGTQPFGAAEPAPNPRNSGGNFYVQSLSKVTRPWELLMFASARGGDVSGTTFWGYGETSPDSSTVRPGYWLVRPPRAHPFGRGGYLSPYTLSGTWGTGDTFDPRRVPSYWGNVDFRHDGRAVTAIVDGHAEAQTIAQLREMNRWADMAKRPDWNFPTSPSQIWW